MASIRRLNTARGVRYEVRWRPAPGQTERSRRFDSLERAKAFKSQTEASQSRGIVYDPTGGRIPFRRYAEQWLEGRSLAPTTRDNYAETLERHVFPTFGATPIGRLTPDEIRRWHRPLRERIPSTASRAYRIMHAILATAVEDDLIPRNPCRIKGAGSDPHTERPFVPAEVVLALADIAHARIRPMILVAGFAGLRYGELRALRLRSYDRLHGTLTVRESIDKRSRRKTTKTDSSQRTVTLPRFALDAIDAHLTTFVSGDPDDPLFPGEACRAVGARPGRGALPRSAPRRRHDRHAAGGDDARGHGPPRPLHDVGCDPLPEGRSRPPAGAAGYSRGARLTRQHQPGPGTEESPAVPTSSHSRARALASAFRENLGTTWAQLGVRSYDRFDTAVEPVVIEHADSDPRLLRLRSSAVQAADDLSSPCWATVTPRTLAMSQSRARLVDR